MRTELIQKRVLLPVVALMLAFALLTVGTAAQPGVAVAAKSKQAKKKAAAKKKAKAKAKRKAAARKRAAKRRAAARLKKRIKGLKFYTPPKTLPKGHGNLIWQRKADGLVPLSAASSTKLVLYTSVSPNSGKRIAVSGSVSFPKGKVPKGGWPLITYGHGTTGIADKCAPSRNKTGGPAVDYINYTDPDHNLWLKAGYAVARTDYEGLGTPGLHPFLVGESEGRGVLDIVRAARQIGPKVSKNFLIAGHSQGGQAALFAGGLAASWVPDLKLKGTVAYAPASNFKTQASLLGTQTEPGGLSALAAMLIKGQSVTDPSVKPEEIMSDPFLAFLPDVTRECLVRLSEPDSLGSLAASTLLRDSNLTVPANANLLNVLDRQNPALKSVAPILLLQGDADTTTLPFLSVNLKNQLVGKGNDLTYLTYPTADHGTVLVEARPDVMDFFQAKLPSGR